jgi:hypothetical protein
MSRKLVPATPSDPHPTTATAGTPWRLVLIEKEGKGSERVFGHRFKTEPECEDIALHFYRPRGYWFRCELEATTIAPWQPPVFEEPPKPQAASTPPIAPNTEPNPPPKPAGQAPRSVPAKYWRLVATSVSTGDQKACERAANESSKKDSDWAFRCETVPKKRWRVVGRSISSSVTQGYCQQTVDPAVNGNYAGWTFHCEETWLPVWTTEPAANPLQRFTIPEPPTFKRSG